MKTEVTLVGGAATSQKYWDDYNPQVVWCLDYLYPEIPADAVFQMHKQEDLPPDRWARLESMDVAIYMIDTHPEIPTSIRYPFIEVWAEFLSLIRHKKDGDSIFYSSFDYMLALAVHLGFDVVNICGFEMEMTTEWFNQRPAAYYWMGVATGRGMMLNIPEESKLIDSRVYGFESYPKPTPQLEKRLELVRQALVW